MRITTLILVTFVLFSCAASGPSYQSMKTKIETTNKGKARIIFYRTEESSLFFARSAPVKLNGEKVGALPYGGFFFKDISEGRYSIKTEMWDMGGSCEVVLDAENDQTYFFKIDPRTETFYAFILGGSLNDVVKEPIENCSGAFKIYPASKSVAAKDLEGLSLAK